MINNDKKISVIIPIYNSSTTLHRLLDSVTDQTYNNLEIILINDGSTDNSLSICQEYQKLDSRIVIFDQENKGVGESRNLGLDNAKGDYITFIDSDDKIDKNYFSILVESALETDADIIESGARVVLSENEIIYPYEKESKVIVCDNKGYMTNYLNFSFNVSVWGKIYKREVINNVRFPKLNINEDFIFLWEIVKRTNKFCENLNVNYTYYLDKEQSLSKAPFNHNHMSMISHVDDVIMDTTSIYSDLYSVALNHHNACILHTLVLYYNYLNSNEVNNLYLEDAKILLDRVKNIKSISSYLLLHEANYNLSKLIDDVQILQKKRKVKFK